MANKSLLITGIHGFVGTQLTPLLKSGYTIYGLDIVNKKNKAIVETIHWDSLERVPRCDIVLHLAGKAHLIPKTADEEKVFYDVNLGLTKKLCEGLEKTGLPKSFIFISTVAVYGLESGEDISEDFPLNGTTPYALSKIQAEAFLTEWCHRNNVILTILRPSLIAGPNPPGNLGAMIKGIKTGKYLSIGGGKARKSVLMVQDIARLIPLVADRGGIYNVCDSNHPGFRELERLICRQLNKSGVISIPLFLAKIVAKTGDFLGKYAPFNSVKLSKMTNSLTFSNEKAKKELDWQPMDVIENFKININPSELLPN
ncbi:NAD-dependent epimerase/dehydratase family protein [Macellibacteroides fermentans]|uniref:NAD-dependent epimerase/dehydratase family protein n=1 Tax=Macellibacteroides fermentans TaxID=879969 RepID=UPI00352BE903